MNVKDVKISGLGWVLSGGVGAGDGFLRTPHFLPDGNGASLVGFDPKRYLTAVKGYLDSSGGYALAAAALALGDWRHRLSADERLLFGVSTATRYGAPQTAYRFFTQMIQKGGRFASPLLFPHGYANTPGNLVAIEFGLGGPHMVFYGGNGGVTEALAFGLDQLVCEKTQNMLIGGYEAVDTMSVPDGCSCANGAVMLWLSTMSSAPVLDSFDNYWPPVPAVQHVQTAALESLAAFVASAERRVGS